MLATEQPAAIDQTRTRASWSLRTSFWVVVGAQVLLLAGSNFPTPLFPMYERHYGFSSGTVTQLFAVYVLALVPTMLAVGRIADRVGRRPLLVAGIATTLISSVAFAAARGVGWLFAGEIVYGIGAGMVMSCISVTIRELHPKESVAGGALAASLAAATGLILGPLVSGLLASITPWPTVAPYALDIVVSASLVVALLRIPETRPTAAPASHRPPVFHVPAEIRRPFVATALAAATGWMLLGWVFGLSPSFLHEELGVHITQPLIGGLFAALVVTSNAGAQLLFRRHSTPVSLHLALGASLAGLALMAGSTLVGSLGVAIVGAVVAGTGAGVAQMNTMGTMQRIAPVHARGGVMSAFLTICYLAMSVPVIIAGTAADRFGLGTVTGWYVVALGVLVGAAGVAHLLAVAEPAASPVVALATDAIQEPVIDLVLEPTPEPCIAGATA